MPSSAELHCGAKQLRVVLYCAVGSASSSPVCTNNSLIGRFASEGSLSVILRSESSVNISCGYSVQLLITFPKQRYKIRFDAFGNTLFYLNLGKLGYVYNFNAGGNSNR